MTKLVIVIGITGNQGGSVANTFLQDPGWRIRGLSRDTNSEASQALSVKGVEMVKADLHDPESLKDAFKGANLVFSVTDFWTPYYNPVHQARAKELGKSIGRYAYELELEQGRNIADAVAREVEGLDNVGFVASTLSHAGRSSKGRYKELWHFDSKADVFPDYVEDKYPELAKKTSYLHTGYYYFSWKYLPSWFTKLPSGEISMRFPTHPDVIIPHLEPRRDIGPFVSALLQLPPGSTLMAASTWYTWPEWIRIWGAALGVKTHYKQVSVDDIDRSLPGGLGRELGEMFEYSNDPGYDGGDPKVLRSEHLEQQGIKVPKTSLEHYIKHENWRSAGVLPD